MSHQLILLISSFSLALLNPISLILIIGFFVFENYMSITLSSIDLWKNSFLAIQLLGSFCIAYFTVQYTQYLQRKREFDNAMMWLFTEGFLLKSSLESTKTRVEEMIARIDPESNSKNIEIIFLPSPVLNSLDYTISKGYFAFFTKEYMELLLKLKSDITELKFYFDSYNQLNCMAPNATFENFNQQKRFELTSICNSIEKFSRDWETHYIFTYPRTFIQWLFP